jgi:hypothetical protein
LVFFRYFFNSVSHFFPRQAWTQILLCMLPFIAAMTGTHHHTQPLIEMGSHELFAEAGLILQASRSLHPE